MILFEMIRESDETGVSGTGKVLSGVILDSGKVVVEWNSGNVNASSVNIYNNFVDFKKIHVDSHKKNKTKIDILYNSNETIQTT